MQFLKKETKDKLDKKAYKCAQKLRELWNIPEKPIEDIYSLAKTKEFLFLRFPNDCSISGIYLEKKDRNNLTYKCIYINTLDPNGRQNFSIAHELYHSYFEKNKDGICLADKLNKDPVEFTAERFASYILIPRNILLDMLKKRGFKNISFRELVYMQRIFGVSFQALIYAISNLKYKQYIPPNIAGFFRYYRANYWEELRVKTERIDSGNLLNSSNGEYEFPTEFRDTLISNLKNGRTEKEKVKQIFDFFEDPINI